MAAIRNIGKIDGLRRPMWYLRRWRKLRVAPGEYRKPFEKLSDKIYYVNFFQRFNNNSILHA